MISLEYHRAHEVILWNTKGYMKGSKGTVTFKTAYSENINCISSIVFSNLSVLFSLIDIYLLISAYLQDLLISDSTLLLISNFNP